MFAKNKIMLRKKFLIILLLSICWKGFAQKDSITMEGTLSVSKANIYKYKLVVGLSGGKWLGYSLLDAGGLNETKSSVSVHFMKEKESMIFAEKSLISSKSKETSFCSVGGLLKMNKKKNEAKGYFLGQDEKKKMCGNGTIRLSLPEQAKKLMTPDGIKDTNISSIVTSQKSETFEVKNAQINIEVWDGGLNDQDSLMISLNNNVVVPPFLISTEKKIVTINLKKGENIIKIKALNEGTEPPNSARILVIDQNIKFPIVSFLRKNEEATIKLKW